MVQGGTREGQFECPRGVAISNDGHILVTDNHRLQKLTFDGVCVKSVGSSNEGSGPLEFNIPEGIAVHPTKGQIFIADKFNSRIQVFPENLSLSHTITQHRNILRPCDVALDNEGYLYVTGYDNHCITKLTTAGEYIKRIAALDTIKKCLILTIAVVTTSLFTTTLCMLVISMMIVYQYLIRLVSSSILLASEDGEQETLINQWV